MSARGKTTDELTAMAHEVSPRPDPREMDMLLSTGERISCALAAMVINDLGHEAISLTGSQAGIVTDTSHTRARIVDVRATRIEAALDEEKIVLVAGFQGVSTSLDVTTLGRGGSDTTAVALAAALGADECEIYTDVAGVFSADPRLVPDARKLPVVSFEEMLEMAASGAKVLQLRSRRVRAQPRGAHPLPLELRGRSGHQGPDRGGDHGETARHRSDPLARGGPHHARRRARPPRRGREGHDRAGRRRGQRRHDHPERARDARARRPTCRSPCRAPTWRWPATCSSPLREQLGLGQIATDAEMGKVSLVGAGMRSHPGVAAKAFSVLGEAGVNIQMISTSPIKISCVVREADVETAVRELHAAFELGADAVQREDPRGVHRPVVTSSP